MKTTKGGKVMNPTDASRKELRKRELKRNKKERKKVREVGLLKKDPETLKDQIEKLEMMKADGALDKARKHKKRQLEDTYNLVLKKRKEYEEKMKEKGETPVMFSHLGPPRRRTTAEEEEKVKHPMPEDSVYYHPLLNPTGAPPPGKPPMYKSSVGPRIPLSSASSSTAASSSNTESDDAMLAAPPQPPPPPLPNSDNVNSEYGSIKHASLPLPPPPPMPPKPAAANLSMPLPAPPLPPPPPPGPPPKEQVVNRLPPPPPPPLQLFAQPSPVGTDGVEKETNQSPMFRPPLPPGPPPTFQEDEYTANRPTVPQKPSYVKSAASTVVKRPLAQHTPELTAMVPASVRVRRETAVSKAKPKPLVTTTTAATQPAAPTIMKPEPSTSSSAAKPQSIDDSYMAFLEDMKVLGALEN